jgi:hypothetical protein
MFSLLIIFFSQSQFICEIIGKDPLIFDFPIDINSLEIFLKESANLIFISYK